VPHFDETPEVADLRVINIERRTTSTGGRKISKWPFISHQQLITVLHFAESKTMSFNWEGRNQHRGTFVLSCEHGTMLVWWEDGCEIVTSLLRLSIAL
jgi:hypothetical protein